MGCSGCGKKKTRAQTRGEKMKADHQAMEALRSIPGYLWSFDGLNLMGWPEDSRAPEPARFRDPAEAIRYWVSK